MAEGGAIGKYRILEELGSGGFATAFKAEDTTLGREVALKVLHPPLLVDKSFVERFFREARTLARLRHPNIVVIHEVGSADGRVFLAMDLAASSLARTIAEAGARPWPEVSAIIEPVAAALDYAHARGVVHRDLKPANILLDENGTPLLSDFGFARALGDVSTSLSASSGILGTPSYIAPELWDGSPAEPAADIYALACIAYELRTGKVLFPGATPLRAVAAHAAGPKLPEDWPPEMLEVFRTALARDPAGRYGSAGAFAAALRAATAQSSAPERVAQREQATPTPAVSDSDVRWSPQQLAAAKPALAGEGQAQQVAPAPVVEERVARSEPVSPARPVPQAGAPGAVGELGRTRQAGSGRPAASGAAPALRRPRGLWRALLGALLGAAGWLVFSLFIDQYHTVGVERLLIDECATLLTAAALAVGGISLSRWQFVAFALAGLLPSAFLTATQLGYFPYELIFAFLPIIGLLVAYSAGKVAPGLRWLVAVGVALIFFLLTLPLPRYAYPTIHEIIYQIDTYERAHVIAISVTVPLQAFTALLLTFSAVGLARRRAATGDTALRHDETDVETIPQE